MRNRRTIRLAGYGYSQTGAYFVTICSQNRNCLFGEIVNGKMQLNKYGVIVEGEWRRSEQIRKEIKLDEFIVMPNHLHGIIFIENTVGANGRSPLHLNRKDVAGDNRKYLVFYEKDRLWDKRFDGFIK